MTKKSDDIFDRISALASTYAETLKKVMETRITEMEEDDNSHYLLYQVLGVTDTEGKMIDEYQNKGRFVYKYAGSFLEEATILCFEEKYVQAARKVRIPNKLGSRPATFEIDCLVNKDAYEIKWRDATTDGDHITKEHTRVKNIKNAGYKPIRIMFYYPNRKQAIRVQETLKTIYAGVNGEYYFGKQAWEIVKRKTGVDLLGVLEKIAASRKEE